MWREETAGMCYWQGACLCCIVSWQDDTMYWQAACSLLLYIVIVRDQVRISSDRCSHSHIPPLLILKILTKILNFNQDMFPSVWKSWVRIPLESNFFTQVKFSNFNRIFQNVYSVRNLPIYIKNQLNLLHPSLKDNFQS